MHIPAVLGVFINLALNNILAVKALRDAGAVEKLLQVAKNEMAAGAAEEDSWAWRAVEILMQLNDPEGDKSSEPLPAYEISIRGIINLASFPRACKETGQDHTETCLESALILLQNQVTARNSLALDLAPTMKEFLSYLPEEQSGHAWKSHGLLIGVVFSEDGTEDQLFGSGAVGVLSSWIGSSLESHRLVAGMGLGAVARSGT